MDRLGQALGSMPRGGTCFGLGAKEEKPLMWPLCQLKILVPAITRWPKRDPDGPLEHPGTGWRAGARPSTLAMLPVKASFRLCQTVEGG